MPNTVTISFEGKPDLVYQNVPDSVTPDQVRERVGKDRPGQKIMRIARGDAAAAPKIASAPPDQPQNIVQRMAGAAGTAIGMGEQAVGGMVSDMPGAARGAVGFGVGAVTGIPKAAASTVGMVANPEAWTNLGRLAKEFGYEMPKEVAKPGKSPVVEGIKTFAQKDIAEPLKHFYKTYVADPHTAVQKVQQMVGEMEPYDAGVFFGNLASPYPWGKTWFKSIGGLGTKTAVDNAKLLESANYQLEAPQLGRVGRYKTAGRSEKVATANEDQFAEHLSQETGKVTKDISPEFIKSRRKELGQLYGKIFTKGRKFLVDDSALGELESIARFEESAGTAGAPRLRAIVEQMLKPKRQMENLGLRVKPNTYRIDGDLLQQFRSELSEIKRGADSKERWQAQNVFQSISGSIARNHPEVAGVLGPLNQNYAATMFLKELEDSGGIVGGRPAFAAAARAAKNMDYHTPATTIARAAEDRGLMAQWELAQHQRGLQGLQSLAARSSKGIKTMTGARSETARKIQRFIEQRKYAANPEDRLTPEMEQILKTVSELPVDEAAGTEAIPTISITRGAQDIPQ